jgi:catechol 2,3-dioxygenase-like lactoylglutathione lyase family enzyme
MHGEPRIQHLVEAAIYVRDLEAAEVFYAELLGLDRFGGQPGRHVFFRVGESVLLVFLAEATLRGETLPAHGSVGPGHFAMGIAREHLAWWNAHLESHGVAIERRVDWPLGGKSLYFRDPSDNSVELVTPGCWGLDSGW